MNDPTIQAMIDDSTELHVARVKVAKALGKLPDNITRRKVLRAVAILLDCPQAVGDRPNV